MIEKLNDIKLRFEEVGQLLSQPAVVSDLKKFAQLSKEYRDLEKVVKKFDEYTAVINDLLHAREVLENEKDPELRRAAVRNLGLINSTDSGKALQTIYGKETDRDVRKEVLNAYFIQNNASGLVAIARNEKDPELKKDAVSKLALMHDKAATDYLMEILQK